MDARISKAIMRSGTVFCVFILLYWATVALAGGAVPAMSVLPVIPTLEYVLPWDVSRWFDPLGALAMIVVIAAVCGSSLMSGERTRISLGAGTLCGTVIATIFVPHIGFVGAALASCVYGGSYAFGVSVGIEQRSERASSCMEAAYAYGIGSGIGAGIVSSVGFGAVIGDTFALLMFVSAIAAGGICVAVLGALSIAPAATRRTFRWLSGN